MGVRNNQIPWVYSDLGSAGVVYFKTKIITIAPVRLPKLSAVQSPKSFPLRPSVNVWWYSSITPTSEPISVVMIMLCSMLVFLNWWLSQAQSKPAPPKKNPKWAILSRWGMFGVFSGAGVPEDRNQRLKNQRHQPMSHVLGLVRPKWLICRSILTHSFNLSDRNGGLLPLNAQTAIASSSIDSWGSVSEPFVWSGRACVDQTVEW